MNKKIATEVALGIIIIIAIVIGGLIWLGGNQKAAVSVTQTAKITQPEPQAAPTETSDWQTYRNEKYGFEFRYPEDWNIREDAADRRVYIEKGSYDETTGNLENFARVWIEYEMTDSYAEISKNLVDYQQYKTIIRNNSISIDVYDFPDTEYNDGTSNIAAYFEHKGITYSGSISTPVLPENEIIESQILKQILSTFKFIN